MKNNVYASIALAWVMALQWFGSIAHADVVIDGQNYSNEWIAAHPAEVAQYINANPSTAANILQSVDSNTRASVLAAYNQQSGTSYTVDTGMAALNQSVATTTTPSNFVTIGNQAYSNEWIIAHPKEVAWYINQHPSEALAIIEKLSPASQTAIVTAYNQTNKTNYTVATGLEVLKKTSSSLTDAWLAAHPLSQYPRGTWDNGNPLSDAQVKAWLNSDPKPTTTQIIASAQKYNIHITQLMRVTDKSYEDLIKMANSVGVTQEDLAKKGIAPVKSFAETRDAAFWAANAGILSPGVYYAMQKLDQGSSYNNPDAYYTQADMELAKKYQQYGYYMPDGSGDVFAYLKKLGYMDGFKYVGPSCFLNTGKCVKSTGTNIYVQPATPVTSTPKPTTPTTPAVPVKNPVPTTGSTTNTSTSTVLSQVVKAKIDAWIASKITSQQYVMTSEDYSSFIAKRIKAANALKVGRKPAVVNQLNYIISELTKIQDGLDEELSLDDLLR
jgi:hypothetical protein